APPGPDFLSVLWSDGEHCTDSGEPGFNRSQSGGQWCHCWRTGSLPGTVSMGTGAHDHLHLHFLHHCDATSHYPDWALVRVAVFRWCSVAFNCTTEHGWCGLLCSCRRICYRPCDHALDTTTVTT